MSAFPLPTQTKAWVLDVPPAGPIQDDTFKLVVKDLPALNNGQMLVKVLALSNDPAQRTWMDAKANSRLYVPPIIKGDIIRSGALCSVISSKSAKYPVGSMITTSAGWQEYAVVDDGVFTSPAISELPGQPYASLGLFGMTGLTAWTALTQVYDLKPEHSIVISGAAGAVGSVAIQIAKRVIGAKHVVGIAGGEEKCAWVKSLGADECIDYKAPQWRQQLAASLADEADVFLDNVGGETLDEMLPYVKRWGQVLISGAVANYNGAHQVLHNYSEIIYNRIKLVPFAVFDHLHKAEEGVGQLYAWTAEGKIDGSSGDTLIDTTFDQIPLTFNKLFTGGNRGKLISILKE